MLIKGIPEIKLDPFEPLYQSTFNFKEGSGNFKFTLKLDEAYMVGLSKMTVESVRVTGTTDSELTIKVTVKSPKLSLTSKYGISGRILVIPVEGTGDLSANFTQSTLKVTIKGHPIVNKKDGEKYLSVDSLTTDMGTKGGRVHFGNLFNGDKTLGRTTNAFFNNNFHDLFGALKQLPEEFFTISFTKAAKAIFDAFPINELLPQ